MWKYTQGISIGDTVYADIGSDKFIYRNIVGKVVNIYYSTDCPIYYKIEGYYLIDSLVARREFCPIWLSEIYNVCGSIV